MSLNRILEIFVRASVFASSKDLGKGGLASILALHM